MNRAQIPDALLKSRGAEIRRIPDRVLAKLTRADLANRLLAAGEYRRRASVPHLDGDLYRHRLGLATEILTTDDPKRAAELVKGAGVGVAVGAGRSATPAPRRPTPVRKAAAPATRQAMIASAAGYLASERAWKGSPAGQALAKAAEYTAKAAVVTDPEMIRGYRELARIERAKAGA